VPQTGNVGKSNGSADNGTRNKHRNGNTCRTRWRRSAIRYSA